MNSSDSSSDNAADASVLNDAPATGNATFPTTVVIGGGVVGAACAYYLRQRGLAVTLIDQGEFGRGCSHANCGYISPSHILPLCQPGAIRSTLTTLFQRNSPLKIRPRLDWELISWLWRFARKCNQRDMLAAGRARQALLNSSRSLYEELITSQVLTDCEWQADGLLFVFAGERHFEEYREVNHLLESEFGLAAHPYAGADLNTLEPALKPGFGGGWLYQCDAHVRPDKVMAAWKRRLLEQGVEIREQTEFLAFEGDRQHVTALKTSTGTLRVEQVVLATGAWTPLLQQQLQATIPVQPGKGYSLTMPRPQLCPRYPMIFEEHRVAITPMQSGYRIGSTMEFAGYDTRLNPARLELLVAGAKHYLKEPLAEPVQEQWYGWRPMSADGVPIIGRLPKWKNAWVATGHSMLGLSMGTGTGKLVAEMITGETPHIDPRPYRVERF